jgi:hypothetical protein
MSFVSILDTQTRQDLDTTPPSPSTLDRMVLWTQAYELWLDSRRSPNTRRAYRMAWESKEPSRIIETPVYEYAAF